MESRYYNHPGVDRYVMLDFMCFYLFLNGLIACPEFIWVNPAIINIPVCEGNLMLDFIGL